MPNREFLLAARGRPTQHVGFGPARDGDELRFDFVADLRPCALEQRLLDRAQFRPPRADEVLAAARRMAARFASLTMPRSKTRTRRACPYSRSTIRITVSSVVTSARFPSNVS